MLKKALVIAALTATLLQGTATYAADGYPASVVAASVRPLHEERPLVVIRFNQRNVYYQRPLYSAIVRALQVKPTVAFEIVSMIPQTGDSEVDQKIEKTSMTNVRRVFMDMVNMGIPESRLNVSREDRKGLATNEVHVFVK